MRAHFERLVDRALAALAPGEGLTADLSAESSDFVRFNRGRVRQPGSVEQATLTLRVVRDGRQAAVVRTLSGDPAADGATVDTMLAAARERLPFLPEDPHLHLNPTAMVTEHVSVATLPSAAEMAADLVDLAAGTDLVGFLARGPVRAGHASSAGVRHWFEATSFNLEWCLYLDGNTAVKQGYAGDRWDRGVLAAKLDAGREALEVLRRPARPLPPGDVRAWLTPTAVAELLALANGWGAFSARALRTAQSPLRALHAGEEALSERVTLVEDAAAGASPRFCAEGWARPDRVPLVTAGRASDLLVSSRSASEYGLAPTGAPDEEEALSLTMAAGELPSRDVLAALGTGLWVSNLWYTNWSNRFAAQATGMTRFATFWVEDGRLVAPVPAMRFDDRFARMFGSELEAVGADVETVLSGATYGRRSTVGMQVPGVLVRGFRLTL